MSLRHAGASGIAVPFFFNTPLVCFNAAGVVAQHLLPSQLQKLAIKNSQGAPPSPGPLKGGWC